MRFPQILASLSLLLLVQSPSQACRLFRGGCSDPCSVASRGSFDSGACAGCGSTHHAVQHHAQSGYYASQPNYSVAYSNAPVQQHSSACHNCGLNAQVAYAPSVATSAIQSQQTASSLIDCGPITTYQVVLQPEYFTETRPEAYTEYREETRYRTRTVARQVAVEVQDYRTSTVMVPKTESKTVEYSVLVPKTSEKTVEVIETVPVWNEVSEEYTVRVPEVVDVTEEYTVQVAQLRDESFTYSVYVPQVQKQQKIQRVTNVVPVTRTRTIQVSRPVTRTQTQTKDYGHWETRVEQAPGYASQPTCMANSVVIGGCDASTSYSCAPSRCGVQMGGCGTPATAYHSQCGGCGSCSSGYTACSSCGNSYSTCCSNGYATYSHGCSQTNAVSACAQSVAQATVTRQVWVPNIVTEEVAVIENVLENQEIAYTAFEQRVEDVPYEATYMVYAPEQRTGTRQVVEYVAEPRTRTRKVVKYSDETRTRVRKELSYKQESKQQTIPVIEYVSEPRTKEVNYTVSVPETKVEPITRTKYETVQEEYSEAYTVRVPFTAYRDVQVQVSRMVPKMVPVTIYPCSGNATQAPTSAAGCNSCGSQSASILLSPPQSLPAPSQTGCPTCGQVGCRSCNG